LVLRTTDRGSTWQSIDNLFNSEKFYNVMFHTPNLGWISGDSGIYSTTDGGESWNLKQVTWADYLRSVYFISPDTGFAVGWEGLLVRTTNGGVSWQSKSINNGRFDHVYFIDNNVGYATVAPNEYGLASGGIIRTTDAGNTWSSISPSESRRSITRIHFGAESTGFAVGVYGAIFKTTNRGDNWITVHHHPVHYLYDILFRNKYKGWAVGSNGQVLKTTDGGESWNRNVINQTSTYNSLFFLSDSIGWAVGKNSIIKTSNAGDTWAQHNSSFEINSVYFLDSSIGWAGTQDGKILFTSNGGVNWSAKYSHSAPIYKIYFVNSKTGFAGSDNGRILRTFDSGNNWEVVQIIGYLPVKHITFVSEATGFIGSYGSTPSVLKTTDMGYTWNDITGPVSGFFYNIHFIDELNIFITTNGSIWKTSNGGFDWERDNQGILFGKTSFIQDKDTLFFWALGAWSSILHKTFPLVTTSADELISDNKDFSYLLSQNYPNPFNPVTKIMFTLPVAEKVELKVFDLFGREVSELISDHFPVGNHEIEFNAGTLASGIYFYRLRTSRYSEIKKMIILK
jgi:photosystem II stability/assembly factor-like uncharacterized protein